MKPPGFSENKSANPRMRKTVKNNASLNQISQYYIMWCL